VLHLGDYLILLLNLCKICNICRYCSRFSLVNSANNARVVKTKENIRYYIFLKLYRLN
jgi:L-lysine 2,3-aminomutase